MNERIAELKQQATFYANKEFEATGKMWTDLFSEKFAELIVQECVGMLHERENQMCNQSNNHIRSIRSDECHIMADCVLKHFGVEE